MPRHYRPTLVNIAVASAPSAAPATLPPTRMRGVNLCGMEGGYSDFNAAQGPVAGTHYPVHSPKLIDYFKSKNVSILRFLFSWERIQRELWGELGAGAGYQTYFEHYKRVVDYATSRGIQVIVEPWQAAVSGDTGGATWRGQKVGSVVDLYAFADFWGKMAAVFKDNPLVQYGLVNEPNNTSTMLWFTTAQKCIDYIRRAGAKTLIHVPGNGWSGAGTWTQNWYDTAEPKRSNAYGWMNANGRGIPLWDPLKNICAEVHVYADSNAGGGSTAIASPTVIGERLKVVIDEARRNKYKVFVGEVGFYAGESGASTLWKNTQDTLEKNKDVVLGYAWWAAGSPGWWDDIAAHGGGHYSVTPTNKTAFTGDTVNMKLIAPSF